MSPSDVFGFEVDRSDPASTKRLLKLYTNAVVQMLASKPMSEAHQRKAMDPIMNELMEHARVQTPHDPIVQVALWLIKPLHRKQVVKQQHHVEADGSKRFHRRSSEPRYDLQADDDEKTPQSTYTGPSLAEIIEATSDEDDEKHGDLQTPNLRELESAVQTYSQRPQIAFSRRDFDLVQRSWSDILPRNLRTTGRQLAAVYGINEPTADSAAFLLMATAVYLLFRYFTSRKVKVDVIDLWDKISFAWMAVLIVGILSTFLEVSGWGSIYQPMSIDSLYSAMQWVWYYQKMGKNYVVIVTELLLLFGSGTGIIAMNSLFDTEGMRQQRDAGRHNQRIREELDAMDLAEARNGDLAARERLADRQQRYIPHRHNAPFIGLVQEGIRRFAPWPVNRMAPQIAPAPPVLIEEAKDEQPVYMDTERHNAPAIILLADPALQVESLRQLPVMRRVPQLYRTEAVPHEYDLTNLDTPIANTRDDSANDPQPTVGLPVQQINAPEQRALVLLVNIIRSGGIGALHQRARRQSAQPPPGPTPASGRDLLRLRGTAWSINDKYKSYAAWLVVYGTHYAIFTFSDENDVARPR